MENIIYSNIIHFEFKENETGCIDVRYAEDLEHIGVIRQQENRRCRPYLDTEFGRIIISVESSFEELEKQILTFIDNRMALKQQGIRPAAWYH